MKIIRPKFSIILFRSKQLKDGMHPVSLRITYQGQRKYYTVGQCRPDEWLEESGRFKKNKEENFRLNALEARAKKVIEEFEETERGFSFDRFEEAIFINTRLKKVLHFIDQEQEKLKQKDRAGSLSITKTLKNSLSKFRGGKDFSFVDIDHTFLEKYEAWLLKPRTEKRGTKTVIAVLTRNGVAVYMRHLRAIYNKAINQGLVKRENYPFHSYQIKTETTRKKALRKEHIAAIINYPTEGGTHQFHSKNYFTFSYLTRGMNFADLSRLRYDQNIIGDRIEYVRSKTKTSRSKGDGRPFSVPIRGLVREMINYYRKNHFTGAGYIFPILTRKYESEVKEMQARQKKSKQVNKDIQDICQALGIPGAEEVTFYSARHSYATISKKEGTATNLIQEALGHGNIKTTEIYLGNFDNEELDKADQHLDEFKIFKVSKS